MVQVWLLPFTPGRVRQLVGSGSAGKRVGRGRSTHTSATFVLSVHSLIPFPLATSYSYIITRCYQWLRLLKPTRQFYEYRTSKPCHFDEEFQLPSPALVQLDEYLNKRRGVRRRGDRICTAFESLIPGALGSEDAGLRQLPLPGTGIRNRDRRESETALKRRRR